MVVKRQKHGESGYLYKNQQIQIERCMRWNMKGKTYYQVGACQSPWDPFLSSRSEPYTDEGDHHHCCVPRRKITVGCEEVDWILPNCRNGIITQKIRVKHVIVEGWDITGKKILEISSGRRRRENLKFYWASHFVYKAYPQYLTKSPVHVYKTQIQLRLGKCWRVQKSLILIADVDVWEDR